MIRSVEQGRDIFVEIGGICICNGLGVEYTVSGKGSGGDGGKFGADGGKSDRVASVIQITAAGSDEFAQTCAFGGGGIDGIDRDGVASIVNGRSIGKDIQHPGDGGFHFTGLDHAVAVIVQRVEKCRVAVERRSRDTQCRPRGGIER